MTVKGRLKRQLRQQMKNLQHKVVSSGSGICWQKQDLVKFRDYDGKIKIATVIECTPSLVTLVTSEGQIIKLANSSLINLVLREKEE